jgi:hypothetical protein
MKPPPDEHEAAYAEVIRMDPAPVVPVAADPHARTRASRAHGLAIFGMALSALVGTLALLAFITIRWPGGMGEYLKVVFVLSGAAFMVSSSMAVFFAMRDTHPNQRPGPRGPDGAA